MKFLASVVGLVFAASSILGAQVKFAWDQINDPSVVGFVIRYGSSSTNKSQSERVSGNTNSAVVTVPDGVRVFAELLSVSEIGVLSFPSEEINFSTARPITPVGFKLTNNDVVVTITIGQ